MKGSNTDMTEAREIYLGGCDVVWNDAVINSSGVVLDGDDAMAFSVYASDLDNNKNNGAVVTGANAVAMTFVPNSNGKFIGHLPASASLTRNAYYWLEVTATPDSGTPHTRRRLVQAVDRGFNP